jgi:hypothetical protein
MNDVLVVGFGPNRAETLLLSLSLSLTGIGIDKTTGHLFQATLLSISYS